MNRPLLHRSLASGVIALGLLVGAGPLEGQASEAAAPLRGELVRHANGTLDVSVLAVGLPAIPQGIWERVRDVGEVALMAPSGSAKGDELRARLAELVGSDRVRRALDPAALSPMGVALEPGGEIRLTWYRAPEAEGVATLAEARRVEPDFTLRILILDPAGDQDDWWGLQAALSQAGIRRVQILSGRP